MKLCVLLSCMHEKDVSIVERANIQTDAVVVNQCDHEKVEVFSFFNKRGNKCCVKFINTTERGLSKSRNMAIRNCDADLCLLSDDDICFSDDYEEKILSVYKTHPDVGVVAFQLIRKDLPNGKNYPQVEQELGFKQILSTSSPQVTFKRCNNVFFDEKMGSGTGNGGGEEIKFLFEQRRKGIKLWYSPQIIATMNPGDSQWFKGFDEQFFSNHGWTSRRILGDFLSLLYCVYFVLKMRDRANISFVKLVKSEFTGWMSKR